MSIEGSERVIDRNEAIATIARIISEGICSINKSAYPLNQLKIQDLKQRIINISQTVCLNFNLTEEKKSIAKAFEIDLERGSTEFDAALLDLLAYSVFKPSGPKLSESQTLEVRSILHTILLYTNYTYLFELKEQTLNIQGSLFERIPKIVLLLNPESNSNLGTNLNLLVTTCINFKVTSATYNPKGQVVRSQLVAGFNTAYEYLVIAAKFVYSSNPEMSDDEVEEIISNSYSTLFIPLMMTPINIFIPFNIFLKQDNLAHINNYIKLVQNNEGKHIICLKTRDEIARAIEKSLELLEDKDIAHYLYTINSALPFVGCPAAYGGFFRTIT